MKDNISSRISSTRRRSSNEIANGFAVCPGAPGNCFYKWGLPNQPEVGGLGDGRTFIHYFAKSSTNVLSPGDVISIRRRRPSRESAKKKDKKNGIRAREQCASFGSQNVDEAAESKGSPLGGIVNQGWPWQVVSLVPLHVTRALPPRAR